ncbi:MAG: S8 family peptidase [Limisphaerales bacterium]
MNLNALNRLIRNACIACAMCAFVFGATMRADSLDWKKSQDRVDASIENWKLADVLEKLANVTGWQIYVEPGTTATISVKFKNKTSDEALRRLLGNISYARKDTNGTSQLFVYRTDARSATQLVQAAKPTQSKKIARIPNELIIQLKRNSSISIEQLAAKLHAKILGRDDRLKLYRLGFDDEAAANAARQMLAGTDDVGAVESNYAIERPNPNQLTPTATASGYSLDPKVMPEGKQFVGLIDTAVQDQGNLSAFLLPGVNITGTGQVTVTGGDTPLHGTGMFETMLQTMGDHPSKVMNFDVYGSGETTTTFDVTQGIIAAVNAGANPINLSLGGAGESELLHQVIKDAYAKGVVFVAAAGNQPTSANTFPAAWPEVLAITAGNASGQIDSYANRGSFIDVIAPGTSYISLNGQTWMMQGTSVSTAYITGLIVNEMNRDHLTPIQAERRIIATPPPGLVITRAR